VIVLGIETSCDETAVAVVEDGRTIRSNLISSQVDVHRRFGGVVPELASRAHVEALNPMLDEALAEAGVRFGDLDAVAVTNGPGLIGALLVGVAAAKSVAVATGIPLIGVNHLEGHIHANFLEHGEPNPPYVCLLVSGGHTMLALMESEHAYRVLGQTLDDAAGEAFDKIARFMGLGFPGGPLIDELARTGNPEAVRFPRAMLDSGDYDFSLSGLKTAVIRHVRGERAEGREPAPEDIAAAFQEAIVEVQVTKAIRAAKELGVPRILLGGGVVANSRLRELIEPAAAKEGIDVRYPSLGLCTDNGAMIAAAGWSRLMRGERSPLDLAADPGLPLATDGRAA
jgi:N6-L-threonylcarbamoyladenine synthase